MTLTPDSEKKATTVDIFASRAERKAIADLLDKVLKRTIFDTDKERLKAFGKDNKAAIQAAPDESGSTDPMMYIKLHNFLRQLRDGIATEAASVDITMEPNTISKDTGDPTTNRVYTRSLLNLATQLDRMLVKRKDSTTTGSIWGNSTGQFAVKGFFDLSQIEGLTSGKDLAILLKQGKIIPEYGRTKVPPPSRGLLGLKGSKEVLANRAYVVVVEDKTDLSLAENLQVPVKLQNWDKFIKHKKGYTIRGVDPTILNAYREYQRVFKPKNKLDILQMAAAFAVGQQEGIIGPRPILRPQILELEDPDIGGADNRRRYYVFTIGGYSGARSSATRVGTEAALEGIESMPGV